MKVMGQDGTEIESNEVGVGLRMMASLSLLGLGVSWFVSLVFSLSVYMMLVVFKRVVL